MSKEERTVSTTLSSEHYKKFLKVKEELGFKWNANVLRYLITKEYEEVVGSGRVVVPFNEDDQRRLQKWAEGLGVTPEQFVEQGVREYMKRIG